MKKDMDMLSGPLFKKIIIFTIPVVLSSMLQLLYNAVDLAVVGQFCEETSLAAVGSTGALTNLIINLFIGISIGANVSVARAIGQKDEKKVHQLVHTAILFSVFAGIFLTIFGVLTARFWLELMDTNADCLDLAALYLEIYFGGMIFNMVYNFGAAILRAIGDTRKPLYFLGIAGLANVGLNFLLVLVFHLDVAGVAIGTIVSQAISSIMIIVCLIRHKGIIHLNCRKLKIYRKPLLEMVIIGLPAGIQGSLFSISNVFVQSAVNSFGSVGVVTGNTAASNVENFVYVGMNSFYQACITFTSQNYGAKKLKNCKKVLLYSLLSVTATGVLLGGAVLLFKEPLLGIYGSTGEALEVGITRLWIICSTYCLCGIMDVFVGGLRGLGSSLMPMVVSIMGACVFRLVWIFTIFQNIHTLEILYMSYPISWFVSAVILFGCYLFVFKKIKKLFAIEESTLESSVKMDD